MKTTRPSVSKYVCVMAARLIIFVAGGWLILAPFALGYQPYGADWVSQTTNDFWMGIPIVVVALISFALFFSSLIASLRATGVVLSQPQLPQAPVSYQPQAPAAYQSDLDRTLSTLAAALAADLSARRQSSSFPHGTHFRSGPKD